MSQNRIWEPCPVFKDCRYCTAPRKAWSDWISHVVCICLKSRSDRFARAVSKLHSIGLCSLTVFYRPIPPYPHPLVKRNGMRGCWESHQYVLEKMLHQTNVKNVLVLEDDFWPTYECTDKLLQHVQKLYRSVQDETDMFMLGGLPVVGFPTKLPHLMTVKAVCMHSYVATRSMMRKMSLPEATYCGQMVRSRTGSPGNNDWYTLFQMKQHLVYPQVMVQDCETESSISSSKVNPSKHYSLIDDGFGQTALKIMRHHSLVFESTIYFGEWIVCALMLLWLFLKLRRLR